MCLGRKALSNVSSIFDAILQNFKEKSHVGNTSHLTKLWLKNKTLGKTLEKEFKPPVESKGLRLGEPVRTKGTKPLIKL